MSDTSVPLRNAVAGGFTGLAVAAVACWSGQPFIVPPLGATIFLCFVSPHAAVSSPRHVLFGHALGVLCGWAALAVTGALGQPSSIAAGCQPHHAFAVALALFGTLFLTQLFRAGHPPAGATTVLVSLGLVQSPRGFVAVEGGAALIVACAWLLHARRGVRYPLWQPAEPT